ncbi:hypothetical protein [Phenylobacterium montanum]|uniref:Uncharacterized protein n=1 Tax=Phenylobacterium montanum TaxID=2823693 RepID=A0A975FXB6_9CAUL|nr:hypothetical protein [Caulobacter sp. S6]QUD86959.1 hypothetical protein KCG34_18050 [Caulobacter sp. S6]
MSGQVLSFDDLIPAHPARARPSHPAGPAPLNPFAGQHDPTPDQFAAWISGGMHDPQLDAQVAQNRAQAIQAATHGGQAQGGHGLNFEDLVPEPKMGVGEDIARTVPGSLGRSFASLAGLPGDLYNLGFNAPLWLAHKLSGEPGDYQPQDFAANIYDGPHMGGWATSQRFNDALQQSFGQYHTPQHWQARTADTAIQLAPAAFGGEDTVLPRLLRVGVPTATSEGSGELARVYAPNNPTAEAWARIGGGLAGGGLVGAGEYLNQAPERVLGNAAQGLTQEQIDLATALRARAADQGLQLTIPEAVQQVTGGATTLGRVQRLVESTNRTAPSMAQYFAQRPGQVRQAVQGFVDQVAPNLPAHPGVLAGNAQRAATGAIGDANAAINAAAQPFYDRLPGQALPAGDYAKLEQDAGYMAALGQLRDDSVLSRLLRVNPQPMDGPISAFKPKLATLEPDDDERAAIQWEGSLQDPAHDPHGAEFDRLSAPGPAPYNDLSNVNRVVQQLRIAAENARPSPVKPFSNATLATQYDNSADLADALARASSPDYGAARDLVETGRRTILDPMKAGSVGTIASSNDLATHTGALYPTDPFPGQAHATGWSMSLLNGQDPNVGANLTGAHLGQLFDQVAVDGMGRPNPYSGAAFVRKAGAAGEKAATLQAGLDGIDPTGGLTSRWSDLADALAATGWRERPGSMTAFNADDLNTLKAAPGVVRFLGSVGDPLEWTKNLSNATGGALFRRNLDLLAQMITDPDTAAILQQAQSRRGSGSAVVAPLLASSSSATTASGGGQGQ